MKIGVVLVTYNRIQLLKRVLRAFDEQSYAPAYILIVDNASTDGTDQYLEEWKAKTATYTKYLITMNTNTGGSGGFAKGLSESLTKDADWIWVSDDDAIPYKDALEQVNNFLEQYTDKSNLSAICGTVINEGKIDTSHRRRMTPGLFKPKDIEVSSDEYQSQSFELNCFSYVGSVISREKMQQVGVTNKDYFIWFDDTEHSLRLNQVGKILCVPAVKIDHNTGWKESEISWKLYYNFRNTADVYRKYMPTRIYQFYYFSNYIKLGIKRILQYKIDTADMMAEALHDARVGKFGIHEIYKPGWKPKEK